VAAIKRHVAEAIATQVITTQLLAQQRRIALVAARIIGLRPSAQKYQSLFRLGKDLKPQSIRFEAIAF